MVSRFFQRTVLGHIAIVGIGYLCLYLWPRILPSLSPPDLQEPGPPPARFVCWLLLIAGIYFPFAVKKYRPVPHNPIQQFRINFLIATYSIVIAVTIAWFYVSPLPYEHSVGQWTAVAAIWIFFAWRLIYGVDLPIVEDITGRQMTTWERAIREAKRSRDNPTRRVTIWYL